MSEESEDYTVAELGMCLPPCRLVKVGNVLIGIDNGMRVEFNGNNGSGLIHQAGIAEPVRFTAGQADLLLQCCDVIESTSDLEPEPESEPEPEPEPEPVTENLELLELDEDIVSHLADGGFDSVTKLREAVAAGFDLTTIKGISTASEAKIKVALES